MSQRQLRLGAFIPAYGHHVAAWRHPATPANAGQDFQHYKRLAQTAERGLFDAVFLADGLAARGEGEAGERSAYSDHFEPLTLLSALSAVTEHIGLIATVSTTYNEPYHLARKFASLDHLSGGRAGWNLVTSATEEEARNFNLREQLPHALRYQRAREYVQVVKKLWNSWEDDTFVRDKASGVYLQGNKRHVPNHVGEFFQVRGPLNVARPVQGQPVLVQAGASEDGRELAAESAEVIFTAWQELADAQAFYRDIKTRAARYGRKPEEILIMPGVFPVVGRTEEEAQAKYQALQDLIHPTVGVGLLSALIGADLSAYEIDGPLPDLPETNGMKSRQALMYSIAQREGLTIRQLYQRIAGARGHRTIVGTPESIADQLAEWFEAGAADGFNIMPPVLPTGLDDFVELVIPVLQARGLFRTQYSGQTLRENLGLARPAHPAAATATQTIAV
ncbi:LLM class flavin-dependent oxidoreductase [Chitinibacter tainanensis]|uniref:LLM class flavin-dependent oxidoreductase n=1 Tax=Chitinibacter tainanensis TaxID=230667 RepID=UPI0023544AF3|nr:LLM class flavin-dependent oxidoreductase [Chitinibacter tainanensis]